MTERHISNVVAWCRMASHPATVNRAVVTALIVGAILVGINHGDAILHGEMTLGRWFRALLTVTVPYLVSTVSSVSTRREMLGPS